MTQNEKTDRATARRAGRASARFAEQAFLHAWTRNALLERLDPVGLRPRHVLDLGGGCGIGALALAERYRKAKVTLVDRSPAMLAEAERRRGWFRRFECVNADVTALPFPAASVDLVFANLLLPYVQDADGLLREVRRVLRPRGYFVFSTVGAGTLAEVREAFAAADDCPHVGQFEDLHDVGDRLTRAGYVAPVLDADRLTVTYADLSAVCRDLRAAAAPVPAAGRRALTGVCRWRRAQVAFAARKSADGRVPVSCEVVYGQAWAPDEDTDRPVVAAREVIVPLARLGKR